MNHHIATAIAGAMFARFESPGVKLAMLGLLGMSHVDGDQLYVFEDDSMERLVAHATLGDHKDVAGFLDVLRACGAISPPIPASMTENGNRCALDWDKATLIGSPEPALTPWVVVLSNCDGDRLYWSVEAIDPAGAVRAAWAQLLTANDGEGDDPSEHEVDYIFPGSIGFAVEHEFSNVAAALEPAPEPVAA